MTTEKRKILIIENQQSQFDGIVECMGDYCFFPEKSGYIAFIDHVRVWVNELYDADYREKAITFIIDIINTKETELILMDHILGGAHHCLTGIDLAREINGRRVKESKTVIPIAFLSKTEHNDENRISAYDKYEKQFNTSEWIHKGYFGDEILKKKYFNSRVIPQIETLLGKSLSNQIMEILKKKTPTLDISTNIEGNPDRELSNAIDDFIQKIESNTIHVDTEIISKITSINNGELNCFLRQTISNNERQ
jgi:hypothetical protein